MKFRPQSAFSRFVFLGVSASLLSSCFIVPGQFESAMDINSDGSFTYSYDGEVHLLGLTQLATMGNLGGGSSEDMDAPCYTYSWEEEEAEAVDNAAEAVADAAEAAAEAVDEAAAEEAVELSTLQDEEAAAEGASAEDEPVLTPTPPIVFETAGDDDIWGEDRKERDCTEEELEERKERAERKKERDERTAKQMAALFGGIDPSDPKAGDKIATRLDRQLGWDKVEHLGDGKFDVEFEISSTMNHDFSFPMMEGMTAAQPFLYAYRRDTAVRIEAPGLAVAQSGLDFGSQAFGGLNLLKFATSMASADDDEISEDDFAFLFEISGNFTLTTDSEILANNTDEGFTRLSDGRRKLVWEIDSDTKDPPMALIELR